MLLALVAMTLALATPTPSPSSTPTVTPDPYLSSTSAGVTAKAPTPRPGEAPMPKLSREQKMRNLQRTGIDEMETGRFQAGAQSLYDQKWSEAVRAFNDSLEETGGGHQHARFGLALALWRLGRAKDAKRLIEICLENRADWPRAKLALAAVSTEA